MFDSAFRWIRYVVPTGVLLVVASGAYAFTASNDVAQNAVGHVPRSRLSRRGSEPEACCASIEQHSERCSGRRLERESRCVSLLVGVWLRWMSANLPRCPLAILRSRLTWERATVGLSWQPLSPAQMCW